MSEPNPAHGFPSASPEGVTEGRPPWNPGYDALPDGVIVTDATGIVLGVNRAFCDLTGRACEAWLGQNLAVLTSDGADLGAEVLRTLEDPGHLFKVEACRPDGERIALELRGVAGEHQGASILTLCARDVSHRDKERESLKRHNAILKSLLDCAGDGIYAVDRHGRCTFLNQAAQNLLGYNRRQVLGQSMFHLIHVHPGSDDSGKDYVAKAIANGRPVRLEEASIRRRGGLTFPCELTAHPLIEAGRIVGAAVAFRDITRQHSLAAQLEYQSSHDPLTGLINRPQFLLHITRAIAGAKQEGQSHVLLFMDLDQFKFINDNSGHRAGDELLRDLAKKLRQEIRRGDVLARLGGDEFGVLLHGCDAQGGQQLAEKFLTLIREYRFHWDNEPYQVGVSIGLVPITAQCNSAEAVLSAGDTACYSARDHGGNQIQVFRANDTGFIRRRGDMLWIGHISEALKNDRFHLYFQELLPLQKAKTGLRAEILLKMEDPEGRRVSPSDFLPAAERANLTPEIDRWVIRHVLRWLSANAHRLDRLESASINLSGNTLGQESFLQFVVGELEIHRPPCDKICFEITETVAISNLRHAQRLFSTLAQMGCKFSLDDFGTGMSSYGYLKDLPVDYVKIDGIFVKEVLSDRVHAKLVQSITDIAHAMGIECVAEYVENAQICDRIMAMGVDYAQGHYIGEARPLDRLFEG